MAKQRKTMESSTQVRFVPVIKKSRRKSARKRMESTGRPAFQTAVFDFYWDYWFRGVAVPLMLLGLATGMAVRGYAAIPLRMRGRFIGFGWTEFHGLDARLLALSVLGIALWFHVRGVWTEHDRLADYNETGHTAGILLGAGGVVAMVLHQAALIFR